MFNESPFSYRSNDIMNVRNKQTDKKSNKQTDPSHTTYIAGKWRHSTPLTPLVFLSKVLINFQIKTAQLYPLFDLCKIYLSVNIELLCEKGIRKKNS